jgi:bifunctional DNA-binding transcriptional regulator/antitoxin component of YhaV-PrlF toxin-antitoxin module
MSLPVAIRKRLGLQKGGTVMLRVEGDEVRMTTLDQVIRQVQARAKELLAGKGASVDDFLAYRREQAELEEQKMQRIAQHHGHDDQGSR